MMDMMKRGKWLLLVLLMGTALLWHPQDVQATDYGLWVNNIYVNDVNAADVLGKADGDKATVRYDAETNTLTLEGAELDTAQSSVAAVILSTKTDTPLTVELVGKNTITATNAAAINCYGTLILTGEGCLNATSIGSYAAVKGNTGVTISGGTYVLTSDSSNGVYSNNGEIDINGTADVTAKGYYPALYGEYGITIQGDARVKADSTDDHAIYTPNAVHIGGNAVVKAGGSASDYSGICARGDMSVSGSANVTATGDGVGLSSDSAITISDQAQVNATGSGEDSDGIYAYEDITVSDFAKVTASGVWRGLSTDEDIIIKDNVEVKANTNAQGVGETGIYAWGSITMSDLAKVTAQGTEKGMDIDGNDATPAVNIIGSAVVEAIGTGDGSIGINTPEVVSINDAAKVTASGTLYGLFSRENITISGYDTVINATGTGEGSSGIYTPQDLTIDGAKVTGQGEKNGLYSQGSVAISGKADVEARSTEKAAIYSQNGLKVTGGTMTAHSSKDAGIDVIDGNITMSGETTSITASTDAADQKAIRAYGTITLAESVEVDATKGGMYATNLSGEASGICISNSILYCESLETGNGGSEATNSYVVVLEGDADTVTGTNSVWIVGDSGTMQGIHTLTGDVTVPQGVTLTIPEGATLEVPVDVTLSNEGAITNKGTITIEDGAVLENNGRFTNRGILNGSVSGDGTLGVSSIGLNRTELALTEGDSAQLKTVFEPTNATPVDVSWTSSAEDVVNVDSQGKLTAHKAGKATVTVTVDGLTATCAVTVSAKSTGGVVTPSYGIDVPDALDGGTLDASSEKAKAGTKITITVTPNEGYTLDTITVTDNKGKAIEVTKQDEGTYTFIMPKGKVSVSATFAKEEAPETMPFVDVDKDAWYHDAVYDAYTKGLMVGTDATHFSPDMTTSRGMIVTMLYRLAGEPSIEDEIWGYPYEDVDANAYYANAVYWARMNGIVSGYSADKFGPNEPITREQLAGMLMRFAAWQGDDVSVRADLSDYSDADSVSGWAQDAVQWAVAKGYLAGTGDNTLSPQGQATRAQTAAVFVRSIGE